MDRKLERAVTKLIESHGPHAVLDAVQYRFYTLANDNAVEARFKAAYREAGNHVLDALAAFRKAGT